MMRRGSKRSASAPDQIENNRNGSQCEITAKPAERRRLELLEHHPVADDVLDAVGHHRAAAKEVAAEDRVAQRRERLRRSGRHF